MSAERMVKSKYFPLVEVELAHQHIYNNPHGIKPMGFDFLRSTENSQHMKR